MGEMIITMKTEDNDQFKCFHLFKPPASGFSDRYRAHSLDRVYYSLRDTPYIYTSLTLGAPTAREAGFAGILVNGFARDPQTHPTLIKVVSQMASSMAIYARKTRQLTRQPPIPTIIRLRVMSNIFRHDLPYCPRFKNNQKIPLRPSTLYIH